LIWVFSTKKISAWWSGVFTGGFTFSAVFLDGNLWSVRGDFVVKRGVLTDTFGALRICRLFQLYFGSSSGLVAAWRQACSRSSYMLISKAITQGGAF
jgi:hypothetical protein